MTNENFNVGDIVEILNLTSYQMWDLGVDNPHEFIGQRYKIHDIFNLSYENNRQNIYLIMNSYRNGGIQNLKVAFHPDQITVYKQFVSGK